MPISRNFNNRESLSNSKNSNDTRLYGYEAVLSSICGGLTPAPVIPVSRFEHPDWPYSVDYFEGPDTQKNKSIVDFLLWRFPFGE